MIRVILLFIVILSGCSSRLPSASDSSMKSEVSAETVSDQAEAPMRFDYVSNKPMSIDFLFISGRLADDGLCWIDLLSGSDSQVKYPVICQDEKIMNSLQEGDQIKAEVYLVEMETDKDKPARLYLMTGWEKCDPPFAQTEPYILSSFLPETPIRIAFQYEDVQMIIDDPGRIEDIVKDLDKIVVYGDPLPIMGVGAEKLLMIFHFGNYREDMVFEEDTMLKISEDETVYGYPYNETDCLKELLHRLEQDN